MNIPVDVDAVNKKLAKALNLTKECENCDVWTKTEGDSCHGHCNLNPIAVSKLSYHFCAQFKPKQDNNKDISYCLDKNVYTCYHCHDYSVIELNGEEYLNIHNDDTMEEEYEGIVAKVEKIVELLNKEVGQVDTLPRCTDPPPPPPVRIIKEGVRIVQ